MAEKATCAMCGKELGTVPVYGLVDMYCSGSCLQRDWDSEEE